MLRGYHKYLAIVIVLQPDGVDPTLITSIIINTAVVRRSGYCWAGIVQLIQGRLSFTLAKCWQLTGDLMKFEMRCNVIDLMSDC